MAIATIIVCSCMSTCIIIIILNSHIATHQYDRDTSCDVTAYHSLVALLCGERRIHFVVKVKLHDHVTRRSAILDPNHFDFDVSVIERQPHLFGYMSEFS